MLRLLVTPRWLGLAVLALLGAAACVALGVWQFHVAHGRTHLVTVRDEQVVPLPEVLSDQPSDSTLPSGIVARASGEYGRASRVVTGVDAAGRTSRWVVAPLDLDGGGGAVVVVRGEAAPPPSAPRTGEVVVTGRLQPPAPAGTPDGLTAATLAALGGDPRGYLVLTAQEPTDARPAVLVSSPAPVERTSGLRLQNSIYAVQWWLFAFFVLFAWVRFFREDLRATQGWDVAEAGEG